MASNNLGPDYARLKATLANSKLQAENNAAYQTILDLINGTEKFQKGILANVASLTAIVNSIEVLPSTIILRGLRASQPSAGSVDVGTLYYVTDEAVTERSDGSTWQDYTDGTAGGGITELTGDVTAGPGSGTQAATIPSSTVTEAMQVLADNTTQNVSTTKHGYAPKAPNDATQYLDGTGAYSIPVGSVNGIIIIKPSDESVSNNTLQNDNDFVQAIGANETWIVEGILYVTNAAATGDIKWGFTIPTGATGTVGGHRLNINTTSNTDQLATSYAAIGAGTPTSGIAAGGTPTLLVSGTVINGANSGNIQFQWAQNTTDGSNATTVLANSWMRFTRVS